MIQVNPRSEFGNHHFGREGGGALKDKVYLLIKKGGKKTFTQADVRRGLNPDPLPAYGTREPLYCRELQVWKTMCWKGGP